MTNGARLCMSSPDHAVYMHMKEGVHYQVIAFDLVRCDSTSAL
jgi:hypothetical protein